MPNVLPAITILSGVRGDTRRYRSIHPSEQLRLAGVECYLSHLTDPLLPEKIAHSSIAIFHRTPFDSYVGQLIYQMQRRGGLVILDVDDLIFDVAAFDYIASPDFADPVRAALYQSEMHRHRQTLEACQAVTTSTLYLAEQVSRLGKPTWVHRNAFSLEMLALSQQAHASASDLQANKVHGNPRPVEHVVIGYASGTPTHDDDFQLVKPALISTLRSFPQAELWLVGPLNPGTGLEEFERRVRRIDLVPWRSLPALLAQFDVNLAPLAMDNPFSQSKSEIKYVEAALVHVPTIASYTPAFIDAIEPGETGFLAQTTEEWEDFLARLVSDAELRRLTGEQAHSQVLAQYHPCDRAYQLIETLDQIYMYSLGNPAWGMQNLPQPLEREQAEGDPNLWSPAEIEQSPRLVHMALYTLRHRDPFTLLKQLWIYFRRMLAPIFPYTQKRKENG